MVQRVSGVTKRQSGKVSKREEISKINSDWDERPNMRQTTTNKGKALRMTKQKSLNFVLGNFTHRQRQEHSKEEGELWTGGEIALPPLPPPTFVFLTSIYNEAIEQGLHLSKVILSLLFKVNKKKNISLFIWNISL